MKKIIILLILVVSCQINSKPPVHHEKMVSILKEMHLVQTYLYEQKLSSEERIKKSKQLYQSILAKHQVSKEEFYEAMNYYSNHVHELDSIYKMVIENTSNPNNP
jgi:hypothetical protein